MMTIKIEEQIKYAITEIRTYPKGYEFEITDILSVNKCVGAANWISFKLKLQTELLKMCSPIGNRKYRKNK